MDHVQYNVNGEGCAVHSTYTMDWYAYSLTNTTFTNIENTIVIWFDRRRCWGWCAMIHSENECEVSMSRAVADFTSLLIWSRMRVLIQLLPKINLKLCHDVFIQFLATLLSQQCLIFILCCFVYIKCCVHYVRTLFCIPTVAFNFWYWNWSSGNKSTCGHMQ